VGCGDAGHEATAVAQLVVEALTGGAKNLREYGEGQRFLAVVAGTRPAQSQVGGARTVAQLDDARRGLDGLDDVRTRGARRLRQAREGTLNFVDRLVVTEVAVCCR